MMDARTAIASLRDTLEQTLGHLLAGTRRFALIDFPNYPNVGDSAIYLGELASFRALGLPRPAYVCDFRSYDRDALARCLGPDGVILLAGGGSFGDLWPTGQALREEIAHAFPGQRIVQLPQTIRFERSDALRRCRNVLNAHPNMTLLVRDRRSLEIAGNEFRARSMLCPDMAFALGPLQRTAPPRRDLLCLLRTDKESALDAAGVPSHGRADWIDEPPMLLRDLSYHLIDAVRRDRLASVARALLVRTYPRLARQRLRRGLRLLSSARVVLTDRLHGHILSLLLGIPHVVLDNSYGKLASFYDTWTRDIDVVQWADAAPEAMSLARTLAERPMLATAGMGDDRG